MRLWAVLCILLLWVVGAVCAFIMKKVQPEFLILYIVYALFILMAETLLVLCGLS